jgi:cysteine-rich repeat protein
MKKVWLALVGFVAVGWLAGPAAAQDECAGDCNLNDIVAINELVLCVNIVLESAELSACEPCDVDNSGVVQINELIAAVNRALSSCDDTPGDARCGNNMVQTGEECDDGNNFSGDGCAPNCTNESQRSGVFDSTQTIAQVQAAFALIGPLNLTGSQTFQVGKLRNEPVMGPDGTQIFAAGEVPVGIRAVDLDIQPVSVLGAVCACVRGIPAPELFGEGMSGSGSVGCGPSGLGNTSYRIVQDHNTTPGDPGNLTSAESPDDPECDDQTTLPGGTVSNACRELEDADCMDPERYMHPGVCNGPRILTQINSPGQRGDAFILNNSAIGQLAGGNCDLTGPRPGGTCPAQLEDYGPDCLPCTDDDLDMGVANNLPTTTGAAEAAIVDANNGMTTIAVGQNCQGAPCVARAEGQLLDCDRLMDPNGSLSGGSLVVAFPGIDTLTLADTVTTTSFVNQE